MGNIQTIPAHTWSTYCLNMGDNNSGKLLAFKLLWLWLFLKNWKYLQEYTNNYLWFISPIKLPTPLDLLIFNSKSSILKEECNGFDGCVGFFPFQSKSLLFEKINGGPKRRKRVTTEIFYSPYII